MCDSNRNDQERYLRVKVTFIDESTTKVSLEYLGDLDEKPTPKKSILNIKGILCYLRKLLK